MTRVCFYFTEAVEVAAAEGASITPLYRQPQPTLTDAEREAIGWAIAATAGVSLRAETLRGLLERTRQPSGASNNG